MPNTTKFKFTKDDLYSRIIKALEQQPGQANAAQPGAAKPNAIQKLLAQAKLNQGGQGNQ
jgi:hypothetical protein